MAEFYTNDSAEYKSFFFTAFEVQIFGKFMRA
jgi:hypothetical protein